MTHQYILPSVRMTVSEVASLFASFYFLVLLSFFFF